METKEKRQLTPREKRQRMEARRKRQEEQRRRKQRQMWLLLGSLTAVLALVFLGFGVSKLVSREPKEITAQGKSFVIALDPGHGGIDTGMMNGAAVEKEVTFKICSKLKIMLESQGYQVVMTREDDTRLSKEERVAAVNASNADLLVSVHCCYAEDSAISGAISHYKADSSASQYLGENIQAALIKENGAKDGGVKEGSYTILTDTVMPAVLIEVGYLSNTQEAEALAEDVYQNDTAKGIAKGIILSLDREN